MSCAKEVKAEEQGVKTDLLDSFEEGSGCILLLLGSSTVFSSSLETLVDLTELYFTCQDHSFTYVD